PRGCKRARATEGELKADVSFALSNVPTVAFPGASMWGRAVPVLRALGAEVVVLAFDVCDLGVNRDVTRALAACVVQMGREGFRVELELWDLALGKKIDDVLAAGHGGQVRVLTGEDVRRQVVELCTRAGVDPPEPDATGGPVSFEDVDYGEFASPMTPEV